MAVSFKIANVVSASNGGDSVTSAAIATVSGQLAVVLVAAFGATVGSSAVTDNQSNVYTRDAVAGTGPSLAIFSCPNVVGGSSHTFTANVTGAGDIVIGVLLVDAAATSSPLSQTATSTGSGPTFSAGPITTNASVPELIVGGVSVSHSSETAFSCPLWTTGSVNMFSSVFGSGSIEGICLGVLTADPSTTATPAVTLFSAASEACVVASYKAASGGGGGGGTGGAWAFA